MTMTMNRAALCRVFVTAATLAAATTAAAQNYEMPASLKASELVPAALLAGPFHSVDENVAIAGAQPNFTIRSQYGTWEARGQEMLVIRVSELPAFEQLAKVSKSDEFMKSAGTAVAAPVKAVGQFIESPLETTGNVFSGIGLIASRVGRVAEKSVTRVGDTVANNAPAQKEILKPAAAPLGTAAPRTFIGDPLGYNQQRREWAQRLKVDPYTFNGALSDKLGEVASVTFASSFPVNVVLGAVIAPLYYAQQFNEQATLEAYQTPALDIGTRNEARLKKMGIEGLPVRTFMRNNYFTPTLQTALVLALESLGNIAGRDQVIIFAARATSETEARYVNNSVMMLAQHNLKVAPLAKVRGADNVIAGETRDGKLLIAAPLDYLPWITPVDDFARRTDLTGMERWLLVSGQVTPRAQQELTSLGWRVSDKLAAAR
ncbi:MAG: hypothetical protein FIA96_06005 [Betaproteobacteria bacterium]|nr:hypothetical protein [Betaproteobacteria bacterium]